MTTDYFEYNDLSDDRDTRIYKAYENAIYAIIASSPTPLTSRQIKAQLADELGDLVKPRWTAEVLEGLCSGRITAKGVTAVYYSVFTPATVTPIIAHGPTQNAYASHIREANRSVVTESFWRA